VAFLGDGPTPVKDIQDAATAAGLSWATVRRARETLGITPVKTGFLGGWVLSLPEDAHGDDASRRCSRQLPLEHLRDIPEKTGRFSQATREDAQVPNDLSTFEGWSHLEHLRQTQHRPH
jgi:hypothetical protein